MRLHRQRKHKASPNAWEIFPSEEALMIQLIIPDCYEDFADDLHAMHRLRYRVFKERLDWQIKRNGGYEVDSFDALRPPPRFGRFRR